MNRNVINLGILSSRDALEIGVIDKYYIYYKSDGDLYLYDSYRNVEWNLFNLTISNYKYLRISAIKNNKRLLKIATTKTIIIPTIQSILHVHCSKTNKSSIKLKVRNTSNSKGLYITATKLSAVGAIKLCIRDTHYNKSWLYINTTKELSYGSIKLQVDSTSSRMLTINAIAWWSIYGTLLLKIRDLNYRSTGLNIIATKELSYGDIKLSVKTISNINTSLHITATKDPSQGTIKLIVNEL